MHSLQRHEGAMPRYQEPLTPAWNVGRPQRAVYELEVAGELGAAVLDVGCGTGEHALFFAERGHVACGVDPSAKAVARGQARARERGLAATFVVEELTRLERVGRRFDSAVDAGTFHRVELAQRADYARALGAVLAPGGRLFVLVFGDHERTRGGPRRVTREELRTVFEGAGTFAVDAIESTLIESRGYPGGANAWLLKATRR